METDAVGLTALVLVFIAWLVFGITFLIRKKLDGPNPDVAKYGPASKWGIGLQSIAFAVIWMIPRPHWWPFRASLAGEVILAVVAVVLAYASSLFCLRSVQTLGKQWTYQARLLKGHELITQGPYSIVRNPIYLGMFGMILGTGLVFSRWWMALIAIFFFLIGNQIRIRAEEKLLRESFGEKFDDYARRVPAFFPRP
ncbi:MAG: isoprenylcysteine carboxylmethyltransferase family protein [Candidatus Acidiferrum sp.]